ncbi:MAG: class I SAM-dependent methyltransferase [Pseudomonadota bacterium]
MSNRSIMEKQVLKNIYDPAHVAELFDRCSSSYRRWSMVASFGMIWLWRRACIDALPSTTNMDGNFVDLMAGTGETWPYLLKRFPTLNTIQAVDNSKKMHDEAMVRLHSTRLNRCEHVLANVLEINLVPNSADCVISTFGLKTFNHQQLRVIAKQLSRILKPGGTFSFIEASDPVGWKFRFLYRFYMDKCLPLIERYALRGAQDFSMIGVYTKNFSNCDFFKEALCKEGLEVEGFSHFFGCATGVRGRKPN